MNGRDEANAVHAYGGVDHLRDAIADRVTGGHADNAETLTMALLYVGDRLADVREAVRDAGGLQPRPVAPSETDERRKHDDGCLLRGAEGRVGIYVCTCDASLGKSETGGSDE